jgi:hypothetical protein
MSPETYQQDIRLPALPAPFPPPFIASLRVHASGPIFDRLNDEAAPGQLGLAPTVDIHRETGTHESLGNLQSQGFWHDAGMRFR